MRPSFPLAFSKSADSLFSRKGLKSLAASVVVGSMASIGFAGAANATLTLDKTSGSWTGVTGGSSINYETVGNEKRVRWGTPAGGGTEQSGFGFLGLDYTPDLVPSGEFKLGTLTHYNFVIAGGTAISAAALNVLIDLASPVSNIDFNYALTLDETVNAAPCVYPGSTICPDKTTISPSSQTFTYEGGTYSLDAFFKNAQGSPVDFMITEERQATSVDLWGRITLVSPPPTPAVPGPLPLFGAAAAFRASRKLKSRISAAKHFSRASTGKTSS